MSRPNTSCRGVPGSRRPASDGTERDWTEKSVWFQTNPANSSEPPLTTVGDRIGLFSVSGLFTTPSSEVLDLHGRSYSAEQKLSRIIGVHNLKMGVNWGLQGGDKTNPQNANYVYQTVSDLLSNIPSTVTLLPGVPPHDGYLQEFGAFIQDDWRVNKRLVLNLGLRADFYPTIQVHATTNRQAQIYNLNPPTSLQAMDFGTPRPADSPYNPDWRNLGPRIGFAWTIDGKGKTVLRGGSGVLYSQQLFALLQNTVSDPFVPATVSFNKADAATYGLKWPMYADSLENIVIQNDAGKQPAPSRHTFDHPS